MKIINKEIHGLKNGDLLACFEVVGRKGEQIKLVEQGIGGEIIFFCELPKTMSNCSYCSSERAIEIGGVAEESERRIYLVSKTDRRHQNGQ